MKPGHWISGAPLPFVPGDSAFQQVIDRLSDLDSKFCERCRGKVLDPLCASCLELALKEVEALSGSGDR